MDCESYLCHAMVARSSRAVSDGVLPTLTPTASRASFLACAVPADPETMASSVATPLEQQFTQIPGVTQLTSSSALGITQITVQFDLGRDVDGAAEDVLAAIALAEQAGAARPGRDDPRPSGRAAGPRGRDSARSRSRRIRQARGR